MDGGNCSSMTGFIFLGITDNTEDKVTTITTVLTADLIGHLANLGMLLLIKIDLQLHTPMYSFLSHPSLCVLGYSSAIHPKMLLDLFSKIPRLISLSMAVAVQFLVFCIFADCEYLLLGVMAHGRYKAISSPLLYEVSMSSRAGSLLMAGVFLVGMTDVLIHSALAFCLCFYVSNEINHFFCDLPPLFLLSRSGK